ncbi:MAG: hypothetical protein WAL32_14055 [Terriglobales bacterium]
MTKVTKVPASEPREGLGFLAVVLCASPGWAQIKMLIVRPDLVHLDRARSESGEDQARLKLPDELYTAIWWYARFPNHYAGDRSVATVERGKYEMEEWKKGIVKAIRAVKEDQSSLQLQNEFFQKAQHPLDTRP